MSWTVGSGFVTYAWKNGWNWTKDDNDEEEEEEEVSEGSSEGQTDGRKYFGFDAIGKILLLLFFIIGPMLPLGLESKSE